ncbi:MAG: D-alanyl-D-alanine carboxypeptidase family protein [Ruminococcus sp.]|nr:D-alanyl-D-alanine carboxypeptidase family protein [Ruminococcus sp.]
MKELRLILLLSAVFITIAYVSTIPGRNRAKLQEETIVSETTESTVETTTPAPYETDENGAIIIGETTTDKSNVTPDNEWALYLINSENPLPEGFTVNAKYVQGTYEMDSRAANYMIAMIDAAKNDGIEIKVLSALRTIEYQQKLLDREIETYKNEGYSDDEAYKLATAGVAIPGESEHNAGLAADLCNLAENFENSDEFAWLDKHAHEYGFILRYPKGKQDITGIYYEPWHYRFVGVYHAKEIKDSGLCLEEYIGQLEGE